MLHVEPLLCDDREIGEYARDVPRQQFVKHIPIATNLRAEIEVLLEMECFYVVHAEML
jgi:hypothetical protein